MTDATTAPISSVSDAIAEQVIAARRRLTMTRDELATAARNAGAPSSFTGTALRNLETGRRGTDGVRRREVSVDELVFLSAGIGCSPLELLGEHASLFGEAIPECRRCSAGGRMLATVEADIVALEELEGVEGSLAEGARVLASAIDGGADGGKQLPALTKELRATLEAIMAGRRGREEPDDDDDELDDLDEPD